MLMVLGKEMERSVLSIDEKDIKLMLVRVAV